MPARAASRQAEQDRLYAQVAEHRCSNDPSLSGDETRLPCGCSRPTFKRALSARTTRPPGTQRPDHAPSEQSAPSALVRSRRAVQSLAHPEITVAAEAPLSRPRPPAAAAGAPHSSAAASTASDDGASSSGRPSPAQLHTALSFEVSPRSSDSSGARADFLSSSSPRSPRNTPGLDLASSPTPHGLAHRLSLPTSSDTSSYLPTHLLFVPGLSCAAGVAAAAPCPTIRVPSRRRVSSIAEAHCGAWAIPGAGLLVSPGIAGWAPMTTAASPHRTPATSPTPAPLPPAPAGGKAVFSAKKLKRVLQSLVGL